MAAIDDLIKQIQSRSNTSQWTGGYGADDATKDMARILDSIGITDIRQFGKIDKYEPVSVVGYTLNGNTVQNPSNGKYYEQIPEYDSEGGLTYRRRDLSPQEAAQVKPVYGIEEYDSDGGRSVRTPTSVVEKDGKMMGVYGTTYGNKVTGQEVPNTYSERQTGDFFGGTFEGKGNTGYGVQFDAQGNPIFYTQGASSKDKLLSTLAPMALMALGAYGAESLLGAGAGGGAAGAAGAGMSASELAALDLALGGAGGSLGAAEIGATMAGGVGGGAGLLESVFDPTFGGELPPVIGGGAESVFDPTFGGELPAVIGGGAESVFDPTFGGTLSDVTTGAIPTASLADKAVDAVKGLGVSDAIRLAGIGTALAGGAKLASDAMGSSGGYPIVPIPSDWTSPIKPTGVAEFTPLAPIDFGNKEILQGTQWEKLLDPNYGKAPAMPSMPTNPSNMSFDQLMGVLGNTRTSIPTQSVSINDVIAGIQSQYGQTPTGSVG